MRLNQKLHFAGNLMCEVVAIDETSFFFVIEFKGQYALVEGDEDCWTFIFENAWRDTFDEAQRDMHVAIRDL